MPRSGAVLGLPSLIEMVFADPAVATEALLNQLRQVSERWPARRIGHDAIVLRFGASPVKPTRLGAVIGAASASGVKFGDWLSFAVPVWLLQLVFSTRLPSRLPLSSASSSPSAS